MPKMTRFIAASITLLALNACVQTNNSPLLNSNNHPAVPTQTISQIHYGNVLAVRPVGSTTETNPLLNAALGASNNNSSALMQAASAVLGGSQGNNTLINAASQVLGGGQAGGSNALVGAVLSGLAANNSAAQTPTRGQEIVVQLENSNNAITIIEPADTPFRVGQRVRVLHGQNGVLRVLPMQ